MTVGELIIELQKLDPVIPVQVIIPRRSENYYGNMLDIEDVSIYYNQDTNKATYGIYLIEPRERNLVQFPQKWDL